MPDLDNPDEMPMPQSQIQRIADLKCPRPLKPSVANARITAVNKSIQKQVKQIEMLENLINDLEKRYKIRFTCDPAPVFNISGSDQPSVDLTGNLTNVNIGINMHGASKGRYGLPGMQGDQGDRGNKNVPGSIGNDGYYGIRGDVK